jgi:hypothetical protein
MAYKLGCLFEVYAGSQALLIPRVSISLAAMPSLSGQGPRPYPQVRRRYLDDTSSDSAPASQLARYWTGWPVVLGDTYRAVALWSRLLKRAFRGEPAITEYDGPITPTAVSRGSFATLIPTARNDLRP